MPAVLRLALLLPAALLSATLMAQTQTVQPPDQIARETADDTLREITQRENELRSDPSRLYALVESRVAPHLDMDKTAQLVLGKYWKEADPAQRQRFKAAFQTMLIRSYSHALIEYDSERIEWAPLRLSPGAKDATVRSTVVRRNGPPIPIHYHAHLAGAAGWSTT